MPCATSPHRTLGSTVPRNVVANQNARLVRQAIRSACLCFAWPPRARPATSASQAPLRNSAATSPIFSQNTFDTRYSSKFASMSSTPLTPTATSPARTMRCAPCRRSISAARNEPPRASARSVARSAAIALPPPATSPPTCAKAIDDRIAAEFEYQDDQVSASSRIGTTSVASKEHDEIPRRRCADRGEGDRAMGAARSAALEFAVFAAGTRRRGGEEAGVGAEHQQAVRDAPAAMVGILAALQQVPHAGDGVDAEEHAHPGRHREV